MALLIDVLAAGVIDNSGNPLDSGKVYVYQVGTTTPVTTYQDSDLTQPNSNPIILDSVGKAEVYTNVDVRLVIEDSEGTNIADIDAIGTNTELLGGTTVIGTSSSDVVEFNSSIAGDLIPTVDDTYDVGSSTKRWAEGHFDELNATSLDVETITAESIDVAGTNSPGWVSNLGIDYDSGIFRIVANDGTELSATNFGYLTAKSTTAGLNQSLKVTYSATFQDAAAASNLINMGLGIEEGTSQRSQFFIYVANRGNSNIDGVDGSSVFFISRSSTLSTTPSASTNIGDTGAIPATDTVSSIFIMQNVTIADYTSLPATLIGAFEMDWDTGPNDWTVTALDNNTGLAIYKDRMLRGAGTFVISEEFANEVFEDYTRDTGTSVAVRGVAISNECGSITETTTTPQDIGVTATITTTGRPVIIFLTSDSSSGGVQVFFDSSGNVCHGRLDILRDGTIISSQEISHTAPTTSLGGIRVPPGSFMTIDAVAAGTYDYTVEISSLNSDSTIDIDDVKIVAYEL
jgi:hypothetical protein